MRKSFGRRVTAGMVHLVKSSGSSVKYQPSNDTSESSVFSISIQSEESPSSSMRERVLRATNSEILGAAWSWRNPG